MGEQALGRQAGFDEPRGRRRLDDTLTTGLAGVAGTPRHDHPEPGGHNIETLADVLTDLYAVAGAAGARRRGGLDDLFDPLEMGLAGWSGRRLRTSASEIQEPHAPYRSSPRRGRPAARQNPRHLRVRVRAEPAQGSCPRSHKRRRLARPARHILLFGPSGAGKSHLAAAISTALIENGHRVLFTRTDLVQKLQAARRDLSLPGTLAKLDRFVCVILDDLGYFSKDQAETRCSSSSSPSATTARP